MLFFLFFCPPIFPLLMGKSIPFNIAVALGMSLGLVLELEVLGFIHESRF